MKKVSTAAVKGTKNFSQPKLTIGLDLGDRSSWYCLLDEVGEVLQEQKLSTTPKAMREAFGAMPRCRIALETGTHSPWVSRLLSELGHQVIVGACAQRAFDRGEPEEGRSAGRADAGAAGENRSAVVMSGAWAGQVLRRAAAGMQCAQHESGESGRAEPGTPTGAAAVAGGNRVAERTHPRVQRRDRKAGAGKLSAGGPAEADQRSGHADRADLHADAGRSAPFSQEPRRGLLCGAAAGTENSGQSEPQMHISKEGDPYLRTLLVQGAHHILGPFGADSDLRRWGLKLAERGGKNGKKRAVIATARKLAVLLHRLWVSGEVYEPLHNSHQTAMPTAA
jgi:transposase